MKDNDKWQQVNEATNYVTGQEVSVKKTAKHCLVAIITLLMSVLVIISIFFIAIVMRSVFNIANFKFDPDQQKIVVNMNDITITESENSLRLTYFKREVKEKVFALAIKQNYWKNYLPTEINKYDFNYYNHDDKKEITNSFVQNDGFAKLDLQLHLKGSFFKFIIPVIAEIKNNAKFYQKFMMFNNFDGRFSEHISGKKDVAGEMQPEERYHGYLPYTFNFANDIDNTDVYQEINNNISKFIKDYGNELAANTDLFPILSTIALGDIDINKEITIEPYLKLIQEPEKYYFGNAPRGDGKEYQRLADYSSVFPLQPFYISYVSNPNVVDDLINLKPTTEQEVINYFKDNPLGYIPFSMVQKGVDDSNTVVAYTPAHTLRSNFNPAASVRKLDVKYIDLGAYFGLSQTLMNGVESINVNAFSNVGLLTEYLVKKYWDEMWQFTLQHKYYFALHYPDRTSPINIEKNWQLATKNVTAFQNYFSAALDIQVDDLAIITFLDSNHDELFLSPHDYIDSNVIKMITFHVGKNLQTNSDYQKPHSFNYSFRILWVK